MLSSTVPSKRSRLSELEQTPNQQNQQSQQNLQQNLQQFTNQQHTQLRQMFHQNQNQNQNQHQHQHQHQLISGDFIQSSQVQQQQQQQITSQQESDSLLTNQDIQRLQKGLDFLVETIVPNKSQHAKEVFAEIVKSTISAIAPNSSSIFNDTTSQRNSSTHKSNSIVLDLPVLTESTHNESENITISPLSIVLNHTFPSSVVELVEKLSKISINPLVNSTTNPTNNVSSVSDDTLSPKVPVPPPSKELCQHLIQEYFTQFNVTIPILDRRKFIDHWRNESTKHSQLLVTATLALAASRYSDDPSIQKTIDKPGGVFFDGAKKLLDSMYDVPRLETVQALLLLSHAETSVSRIDSSYMFLGMAVQMARTLHLERNDTSNLLPEEDEERRRVFYCIYCCDRWISFMLGKPYAIEDININVPLPTLPSFERPARNFFIAFIKLSRIIGQIWRFGYSSQPKAAQSTWTDHAMDQKSMLRQIRAALAKWLKELPDELQYQYLPNTDIRSLFQLARFSVYAGYINILFHTCIILLHQPYLAQAYDNPKIEANQGPIKTCLTAATTITDIAKTTRHFDKKALCNFQYPIYGILQSAIMEMVIMNGSADHAQDAKKALNDTVEELRCAAENANYGSLKEIVKELESIMMITNGSSGGNHLSIPLPLVIQMLEQNNNNIQNMQKSSSVTNGNNVNNNNNGNNDNNTTSNASTTMKSNSDSLTIVSNNESNSPVTMTNTLKNSNTPNLQNQSQQQSDIQRAQLQNQQISQQFITFNTSPTSSPTTAVTSLHPQFHNLSSPFDTNNQNDNNQISPQSGNWDQFYMDEDFLYATNSSVPSSHNQVMDDLSIYPGFNNYSDNNPHDGSVGPR
uniref:Acetamidase regulatory protein n=1 Tax=Anthurium amnicola TaxID=1678845 RepID=A0A1D1YDE6_9ARAE